MIELFAIASRHQMFLFESSPSWQKEVEKQKFKLGLVNDISVQKALEIS